MLIAFDAKLFYDEKNHVPNYGNIEVLTGIYAMKPSNRIVVWSDEGTATAKRLGQLANLPNVVEYLDKQTAEKATLHFATAASFSKGTVVVRSD